MEYDYIVVGAGSAGCVMANRLSENPSNRVLLLEAGGADINPFIHMPAGLAQLANNTRINWAYQTEPQEQLNHRSLFWPRGKVLGGSSSINAMVYHRGQPEDYNGWQALGNAGWDFEGVLPYFLKAQDQERGSSNLHATGGPLSVQDTRYTNPLSKIFIEAGAQLGYPLNDDFNGQQQAGFGIYQVTQRNGKRCSSAVAYLKPALKRPNLEVITHALAEKVLIENRVAYGVEVAHKGATRQFMGAEVILCGGAINSPQMLMLSGVGPADHLRNHDIEVKHQLEGVGGNLQDHLDICTLISSSSSKTYDKIRHILAGLRYVFGKGGPATSNLAEAGGFISSPLASDSRPDIQFHFLPAMLDNHGRNLLPGRGMTIHACQLRPRSKGEIRLRSADPSDPTVIQPNYLQDSHDLEVMLECVRLSKELFMQSVFDPYRDGFIYPEESVKSKEDLTDFVRRKAETIYHPVGTCKMGNDPLAVVDTELRVHGVEQLRIADASIMPKLISGNTNAPVIMIAEKCADGMLRKH
jgi:choline dehydrogenase-like flavoprotein